jgi:hypothetical protein
MRHRLIRQRRTRRNSFGGIILNVLIGTFITRSSDISNSGRKVGVALPPGELALAEQLAYLRPFLHNTVRYPDTHSILLHDGLSALLIDRISTANVECVLCDSGDAKYNCYEWRLRTFHDYIVAHADLDWIWLNDVCDVSFVQHPFDWLQCYCRRDQVAVGSEFVPYYCGDDPIWRSRFADADGWQRWYSDTWRNIPTEYGDEIRHRRRNETAPTAGSWGGRREQLLRILNRTLYHIDSIKDYLASHPPSQPILIDMTAFAAACYEQPPETLLRFKLDGRTAMGNTLSPLVHDRTESIAVIDKFNGK